jgi:hypothetical protein
MVNVKLRSDITIQESSDVKTAAVLQNYVFQNKFWHNIFPNIGIVKSSIQRILEPHQRHYYKVKCLGANWVAITMDCELQYAILCGVLVSTEQLRLSMTRLVFTLLYVYCKKKLHLSVLIGDSSGHTKRYRQHATHQYWYC